MNYQRDNFKTLFCDLKENRTRVQFCETYSEFTEFVQDFRQGLILNLVVIGPVAIGKSQLLKQDRGYISGQISQTVLYRHLWDNQGVPIILDDVDSALTDKLVTSLLRQAMDTCKPSTVCYPKEYNKFIEQKVSLKMTTDSPFCLLLNHADRHRNQDVKSLLSKSRTVVFDPTPAEVLQYIGTYWNKSFPGNADVLQFCIEQVARIPAVNCRDLEDAVQEKNRGKDWKRWLLNHWSSIHDPEGERLQVMGLVLKDPNYKLAATKHQFRRWNEIWKQRTGKIKTRQTFTIDRTLYLKIYGEPLATDQWDLGKQIVNPDEIEDDGLDFKPNVPEPVKEPQRLKMVSPETEKDRQLEREKFRLSRMTCDEIVEEQMKGIKLF